jgi:putative hydrolase of HD superfamily
MRRIVDLLFQVRALKHVPRSGFGYLGAGRESVAEHSFCTAFIAYVMAELEPDLDVDRLVLMCLVHDLLEARTGDLNAVHKEYVSADLEKALNDTVEGLPFGDRMAELVREFEENRTPESRMARDADQLALILDLKALADVGYRPPERWLPPILERLQTAVGKRLAREIMSTPWDGWWLKNGVDRTPSNH